MAETLIDRYQDFRTRRFLKRESAYANKLPGWRTQQRRRALVVAVACTFGFMAVVSVLCAFGFWWAPLLWLPASLVFFPLWVVLQIDLAGSAQDERDDYTTCAMPSHAELLQNAGREHLANMAALPGLLRDAVKGFTRVRRRSREHGEHPDMAKMFKAPPTFLNHVVSPVRTFATASLALADVKETAKHLGVTFNDIVLATAAGGLRELLLRYDGRADRPIDPGGHCAHHFARGVDGD